MADLDGDRLKGLVRGALATNTATSNSRADQLAVKRILSVSCPLAVNASTQITLNAKLDRPIRVTAARFCSNTAQASAAADSWTFTLKYDDAAGGTSTAVTSAYSTTAVAITANQTANFTLTNSAPVDIATAKRLFLVATAVNTAAAANAMVVNVMCEYEET